MLPEIGSTPPLRHDEQNYRQREELAQLDTHIKRDHIRHQPLARKIEFLKLGGQSESVDQAEAEHSRLGVDLPAEQGAEPVEIVERLVDYRKPDQGVDDVRIDMDSAQDACQQCDAVADRETGYIGSDVL